MSAPADALIRPFLRDGPHSHAQLTESNMTLNRASAVSCVFSGALPYVRAVSPVPDGSWHLLREMADLILFSTPPLRGGEGAVRGRRGLIRVFREVRKHTPVRTRIPNMRGDAPYIVRFCTSNRAEVHTVGESRTSCASTGSTRSGRNTHMKSMTRSAMGGGQAPPRSSWPQSPSWRSCSQRSLRSSPLRMSMLLRYPALIR